MENESKVMEIAIALCALGSWEARSRKTQESMWFWMSP